MDFGILLIVFFILALVAKRGVLIYYRRLARKHNEPFYPKYAKPAYAIFVGGTVVLLLLLYLIKVLWVH